MRQYITIPLVGNIHFVYYGNPDSKHHMFNTQVVALNSYMYIMYEVRIYLWSCLVLIIKPAAMFWRCGIIGLYFFTLCKSNKMCVVSRFLKYMSTLSEYHDNIDNAMQWNSCSIYVGNIGKLQSWIMTGFEIQAKCLSEIYTLGDCKEMK